jgi:hypothetical protein
MTRRADSTAPGGRPVDPAPTRLAELVAGGSHPFPPGLGPRQTYELAEAVRRIRRGRLLRLVARAIAADLAREPRK